MQKLRFVVQWLFFAIFLTLMITGNAQFWMAFIFISVILSAFLGRFYCGWACPINTVIRPANWIGKKLGTQKNYIPEVFKREKIRWIVFALFLVGLAYTIYTITQGTKFPLPVFIIAFGLIITIFVNENTWHRYLCPWGVLFGLTGRFSKLKLNIDSCKSCSLCQKKCPAEAITMTKNGAAIDPTYCLLCLQCQPTCPTNTIKYGKRENKKDFNI